MNDLPLEEKNFLDWQLRSTQIAKEIVFFEELTEDSARIGTWLDAMSRYISAAYKGVAAPTLAEYGNRSLECAGLSVPVAFEQGIWTLDMEGLLFKIHQSVQVADAVSCIETLLQLRNENDDISRLENPIIEVGLRGRIQGPFDVAESFSSKGTICFYLHPDSGRVWACALEDVTKGADSKYRHTTLKHIAKHEMAHLLELNPEVDRLNKAVAQQLNAIRSLPSQAQREASVKELLDVGYSLNPKYCPMKIVEWMADTLIPSKGGVQGRSAPRFIRQDFRLAKELVAEAFASLRWGGQAFPPELSTPTTQLAETLSQCRDFQTIAIAWGGKRQPRLIPLSEWTPKVRTPQTAPAFDYKPVSGKLPAEPSPDSNFRSHSANKQTPGLS